MTRGTGTGGLFSQCVTDSTIEGFLREAAKFRTRLMLAPEEFRALSANAMGRGSQSETQNATLFTGFDGVRAPPHLNHSRNTALRCPAPPALRCR